MPTKHPFDPVLRSDDEVLQIVYRLYQLTQLLNQIQQTAATSIGLTPLQGRCLLFLRHSRTGACTIFYLTKELGVSQATVSGAVESLIKKGLLYKIPSAEDLRIKRLHLTGKGQEYCGQLQTWADPVINLLRAMQPADIGRLSKGLEGLTADLRYAELLTVPEVCCTCGFCRLHQGPNPETPHWCNLLDIGLSPVDALKQCPEHTVSAFPRGLTVSGAS